ncbi:MAG: hypothetical protein A2744_03600 [Candidatus Buchananbacteria bacterium RIFCSPHIGHO2_01_FULL_44_11]|uniref:Uncharacterized protein n=1 Tax=Candidatus Buchananbacteria bacterium RIFCSPHIGHO2_01_FULL_44_11 TaxID=1797535 RepID=A0A1G1Y2U5_9BACT|nr:MAG: hypothetical protein A2744_03600 [Candidatus Buchananbacteria bacterium RIFCSPHIGHO2_01_FULL_44_11]
MSKWLETTDVRTKGDVFASERRSSLEALATAVLGEDEAEIARLSAQAREFGARPNNIRIVVASARQLLADIKAAAAENGKTTQVKEPAALAAV